MDSHFVCSHRSIKTVKKKKENTLINYCKTRSVKTVRFSIFYGLNGTTYQSTS